jgi:threonine/homoserine/homoserine lactone efflux protein
MAVMEFDQAIVAYTLTAALLTIAPGPDTVLVLRSAIIDGPRRAAEVGCGIACGCLAWGAIVAVGLGALVGTSEVAFTTLKLIGAAYLACQGARMLIEATRKSHAAELSGPRVAGSGFRTGLLTNLLNPKVGALYVALFPQFIPDAANVPLLTVGLAAIHAALRFAWFLVIILTARSAASALAHSGLKRWFDRIVGVVLVAFGVRLALASRT